MSTQREASKRRDTDRRGRRAARTSARNAADASQRRNPSRTPAGANREARVPRSGPQTSPITRPAERPGRAKNTSQAKARAKARKAKAPKVVRPKLTERLAARLAEIDLRPHTLLSRIPFVVLVIGSLGVGLGLTLWLSTDAAERSYQLSDARERTRMLQQQKESLERDVREAESAPALAEAARKQGMIPTRDTAHLVQAPDGTWVVVGTPRPADGVPPPPLNAKLPDAAPPPPPPPPVVSPPEVAVRVAPGTGDPTPPQVLQRGPNGATTLDGPHLPGMTPGAPTTVPGGPLPVPGSAVPTPAPNSVHADLLPSNGFALPAPAAQPPVLVPTPQPPVLMPTPQPPGLVTTPLPANPEQFGPVIPTAPAAPGATR